MMQSDKATSDVSDSQFEAFPEVKGKTVVEYAIDVDERPFMVMVRALKGMHKVEERQVQTTQFLKTVIARFDGLAVASDQFKHDVEASLLGEGGLMEQMRSIFESERKLNREAAKGGLLDAKAEIEVLTKQATEACCTEIERTAAQSAQKLNDDLHKVTLGAIQSTLSMLTKDREDIERDRAKVHAEIKYAKRFGLLCAAAGLMSGVAFTFVTLFFMARHV